MVELLVLKGVVTALGPSRFKASANFFALMVDGRTFDVGLASPRPPPLLICTEEAFIEADDDRRRTKAGSGALFVDVFGLAVFIAFCLLNL